MVWHRMRENRWFARFKTDRALILKLIATALTMYGVLEFISRLILHLCPMTSELELFWASITIPCVFIIAGVLMWIAVRSMTKVPNKHVVSNDAIIKSLRKLTLRTNKLESTMIIHIQDHKQNAEYAEKTKNNSA